MYWRARLTVASNAYDEALTDEQQDACIAAGAKRRTRPRMGQSGQQTGQQYWVGEECKKPPALAPKAPRQVTVMPGGVLDGASMFETDSPLVGAVPATHPCQLFMPSPSESATSAVPEEATLQATKRTAAI